MKTIRGLSPRLKDGLLSGPIAQQAVEKNVKAMGIHESIDSSPVRAFKAPTPIIDDEPRASEAKDKASQQATPVRKRIVKKIKRSSSS